MRCSTLGIVIAAGIAATPAAASTVEFVVNGDFTQLSNGVGKIDSQTVATGWTSSNYNFVFTDGNVATPTDNTLYFWTGTTTGSAASNTWNGLTESGVGNFVAMDGDYDSGAVKQTITNLTVGQSYTLSFDYAFGQQHGYSGATWQNLTASIGGFSVTLPSAFSCTGGNGDGQTCTGGEPLESHGFSGWSTFTATIVATATNETLSFLADGSKPVPPFAMISDVSLTGPAGVPEASTWAMMALGFAGLGFAGYRSNRRKGAFAD